MFRIFIALSAVSLFALSGTAAGAPRGGGGMGGFRGGVGMGGFRGGVGMGGYRGGIGYGGYRGGIGYGRGGYGYGRGYGGYGLGFGTGVGLGYLFSSGGYGYIPMANRGGYYSSTGYSIPAYDNTGAYAPNGASTEWGLRINQLTDGPAKQADLRVGDIVLGIGQTRTQTFDELQSALAASSGKVDIVFINNESKKIEKLSVAPVNGRIGVEVVPVDVR